MASEAFGSRFVAHATSVVACVHAIHAGNGTARELFVFVRAPVGIATFDVAFGSFPAEIVHLTATIGGIDDQLSAMSLATPE